MSFYPHPYVDSQTRDGQWSYELDERFSPRFRPVGSATLFVGQEKRWAETVWAKPLADQPPTYKSPAMTLDPDLLDCHFAWWPHCVGFQEYVYRDGASARLFSGHVQDQASFTQDSPWCSPNSRYVDDLLHGQSVAWPYCLVWGVVRRTLCSDWPFAPVPGMIGWWYRSVVPNVLAYQDIAGPYPDRIMAEILDRALRLRDWFEAQVQRQVAGLPPATLEERVPLPEQRRCRWHAGNQNPGG
ncbi:MAG: hypothetical protein KKB13_07995 [Chloroflexi bacterium]|nr:hypothetical protein [Chloroflexota bacterium]MBU1877592.1 hypothetical protein [Chloroflexota bacterium]